MNYVSLRNNETVVVVSHDPELILYFSNLNKEHGWQMPSINDYEKKILE